MVIYSYQIEEIDLMENEKMEKCAGCEGDCAECESMDNIVELSDAEGNTAKFEIYSFTEYEGRRYVGLVPAEENEYINSDEMAIFYLDDAEEELLPVEDDDLAEAVFNQMMAEDSFDEEEGN